MRGMNRRMGYSATQSRGGRRKDARPQTSPVADRAERASFRRCFMRGNGGRTERPSVGPNRSVVLLVERKSLPSWWD